MKQYIVDAFTGKPFSGNPAAVCVMDRWPSDEAMIKLARENNLSETAFIVHDTLLKNHAHEHTHTFTHTHGGTTHTHTIVHSHTHSHFISEETHSHHHSTEELEKTPRLTKM